MKKIFIILFLIPIIAKAQLVIPRVPSLASVTSPLPGMQVYSITEQKMYFRTLTSWVDMSVVSYTGSNGLRLTGSVFELGNTALLSKSTTIRTGLSNKFSIVSKDGNDSTWFQTDTDASGMGIRSNSKGQMIYATPQQMFFKNDSVGMILTGTDWTINDNRLVKKGIQYSDDYSGGFDARSLIDKGYGDANYLEAADIAGKLNISDTASMLTPYLKEIDTVYLSDRTNLKLNTADTSTLSNRINLKLNISDTATLSNRINLKLNIADTITLSNRINLKLNTADTSTLSNRINLKKNSNDSVDNSGYSSVFDRNFTRDSLQTNIDLKAPLISPSFTTPALGTPASGVMTNVTGTAAGLTAGNVTTNANLTGNVTSVGNATTIVTIPTTIIGIPLYSRVTGSNATTTGQSLVNITGLSNALVASATYEFTAVLIVSTTAVTTGTGYGVNFSAAGATVESAIFGSLTTAADRSQRINALNTSSSGWLTTSAQTGAILIKGIVTTTTNAGNFTVSHLKVTSGTSTVFINSYLVTTRIL